MKRIGLVLGLLIMIAGGLSGCSRDLQRDAALDQFRTFRPVEREHLISRWEMVLPEGWLIAGARENTLPDGWTGRANALKIAAEPNEGGARVTLWVVPLEERLTRQTDLDSAESARYLGRSFTYHYFLRNENPDRWRDAAQTTVQVFGIGY